MTRDRAIVGALFALGCSAPGLSAQPPAASPDTVDPGALAYVAFAFPPSSLHAQSIRLGCAHACVLSDAGAVSCWGRNQFGELADGTTTDRTTPAAIAGLPPVVEIATTCAASCARTAGGEVWCWGGGDLGEIGDGDRAGHRTHPVQVPGLSGVRALAGSGSGTCAVIDDAGHARCWGTFDDHAGGPLVTGGDATRPRDLATPLAAPPRLGADSPFRACVIASDRTVSCWGSRESVGVSVAPIDPSTPMTGITGATDLAAGSFLTCASDASGVSCWGSGVMAFSLGGSAPLPPTRIAGMATGAELAVGDDFVCGTRAGQTRCAGYGALIDATARVHPLRGVATRVPALDELHGVVAGPSTVCGIDRRGGVHCVAWLSGHEGEPPVPPS